MMSSNYYRLHRFDMASMNLRSLFFFIEEAKHVGILHSISIHMLAGTKPIVIEYFIMFLVHYQNSHMVYELSLFFRNMVYELSCLIANKCINIKRVVPLIQPGWVNIRSLGLVEI